jgi:flagellar basal-body rod protein FlgF
VIENADSVKKINVKKNKKYREDISLLSQKKYLNVEGTFLTVWVFEFDKTLTGLGCYRFSVWEKKGLSANTLLFNSPENKNQTNVCLNIKWHHGCFILFLGEKPMSTKGIYTALSGAMAQTLKMDTIANNIANVNTTGFKRDQQTFGEYLTAVEKEQQVMNVPRVPASIESFYDMNGGDKSFVDSAGTYTNFEQGSLKTTGGKLDVALDGPGFFEISTPQGIRLTRAGNFTIDGNGQLVNKDGNPVLLESADGVDLSGADSQSLEQRTVKFSGKDQVYISDAGEVFDGETKMGKLSVLNVLNSESLQKVGNNNYDFKPNMAPQVVAVKNPSMKQGFIEASNVNIIHEMTDMIMAQRVFEGTQKAMKTYDDMADKLNQVGNTKA